MSGYLYELPTTESVSFSSCYDDVIGSYTTQVADTTERRANLRTLLKDAKRNSEKDYLRLVKVSWLFWVLLIQMMLTCSMLRPDFG